jgi:hypothetical protein
MVFESENYEGLLQALAICKRSAMNGFRINGKRAPNLPSWGGSGYGPNEFYTVNDFEILSVCFRLEVEQFLFQLRQFYDFERRRPSSFVRGYHKQISEPKRNHNVQRQPETSRPFTGLTLERPSNTAGILFPEPTVEIPVCTSAVQKEPNNGLGNLSVLEHQGLKNPCLESAHLNHSVSGQPTLDSESVSEISDCLKGSQEIFCGSNTGDFPQAGAVFYRRHPKLIFHRNSRFTHRHRHRDKLWFVYRNFRLPGFLEFIPARSPAGIG